MTDLQQWISLWLAEMSPVGEIAVVAQILLAVQSRIQSLNLTGVVNTSVVVRKIATDRDVPRPAICISELRQQWPTDRGTNSRDDGTYQVVVAMYDADNQDPTYNVNLGQWQLWRQQIRRAFINQSLPVATVYRVLVEPGESYDLTAWKNQYFAAAIILNCFSREPRGVGV